jgi:hypothetical protein
LAAAIAPYQARGDFQWKKMGPTIEDVFIHLVDKSKDNFS